jgi:hypothetical protein
MSFYAKIQYRYNEILQDVRDNIQSPYFTAANLINILASFKKYIKDVVKPLPKSAKDYVLAESKKMVKHVSIIFDYLKKQDLITAEDYLKYYYQFDEEGKIRKILDKRILQTIEEMPKLVRSSRKPDMIKEDDYTQIIDIPVMKEESSPEADIQNLYDEFVAQINNGLASLGDIKTYPQMLSELYELIRPQIYPKDRIQVLKKVKEMIQQLDDLIFKLSANPSKVYTLSRIYIPDTTRGLYPEEKVSGKYSIVKEQPQRLMRLPQEDIPILQRDVVDFFENIPASKDIRDRLSEQIQRRNKKYLLSKELKQLSKEYLSQQQPMEEIPYIESPVSPGPKSPKRKYTKKSKDDQMSSKKKYTRKSGPKTKEDTLENKTIVELKDYMRKYKIKGLTGKKSDLIKRIRDYLVGEDD